MTDLNIEPHRAPSSASSVDEQLDGISVLAGYSMLCMMQSEFPWHLQVETMHDVINIVSLPPFYAMHTLNNVERRHKFQSVRPR